MDADHIAAITCLVIAALMLLPSIIVRLGATETDAPRRESHSETAHRLDAEATAPTRAAHSGRKAGRTAVTR